MNPLESACKTPCPVHVASVPLTDREIDCLLFGINNAAMEVDSSDYGLPLKSARKELRALVRAFVAAQLRKVGK